MNSAGLVRNAAALVALAICSACGGAAVAPSSANLSALPGFATIAPSRQAQSNHFEYIINNYGTYASIFDYPNSDRQIGKIHDVGGQGCTNVLYGYGKKTFWIVAAADKIEEYQVPKKPLKRLSVSIGSPSSCAMDTSGDLAVGILEGSGGGDIVIFKNASGSGTVITTPLVKEYFDGYDTHGNLFFDGFNSGSHFEFDELPEGSRKAHVITTSNSIGFPGSVQWDGKYMTITDQKANAIYQYTISGRKATLKGTVSLSGSNDCSQTWIAKGVVFCADSGNLRGEVFDYPAGGSVIDAVFTGNFDLPLGTVAAEN
ncbi:MAG TPA: hypothetical protein VKR56_16215 [Candidatus Cybelea sp.]|jgi:hypothetical protein|nr:hypothetical protein [Candidatus Cybelea sp.]